MRVRPEASEASALVKRSLDAFGIATADDTAYLTTHDRKLLETNEGWTRFAQANGDGALLERCVPGFCVDDVVPEVLRSFFVTAYERALATGERFEHDYECSSADVFRRLRMIVYPVRGDRLLFVHSRIVERPHERDPASPPLGLIKMCAHCRRVRESDEHSPWIWVPEYLTTMPLRVSHGLCEPCFAHYYPEA